MANILENGTRQANRTGIDAISLPGAMLRFDLDDGFPAITTKKLAFRGVVGEVLGFLRGYDNAADFRRLGCNWWDQNANENNQWVSSVFREGHDDLGRIYGVQWRKWRASDDGDYYDQVQEALTTIVKNPTSRRIIINAWRPDEFNQMALPPCHVLYQFIVNVERKELNLCMYQRSCDMFLGVPMNIAGSALLLEIFAKATGLRPRHFTHFLADAHIYVNHIDQVREQLTRKEYPLPQLKINCSFGPDADHLAMIEPHDIQLIGYESHPPIKAEMAV